MSDMFDTISWPDTPFPLRRHAILIGRRGSEAHGTYVPPYAPDSIDDRDLMGVVIPPRRYYLALDEWSHAEAIKGPWDVVLYELRKCVSLLCRQNPNVLSLLWLRHEDYLHVAPAGRELLAHRDLFRDRGAAYHALIGYAYGQLKRMTSFGEFRGYMGAKRKRLVERFGYDTKNAAHLLRLLHMGEEYLRTGVLNVFRTWDRAELLAVKRGEWLLADVQAEADRWFTKCREARDASPLPERIDMDAVRELLLNIMGAALRQENLACRPSPATN